MAVLGYNTKGVATIGFAAGLKISSPFVLATPQTLTELHGWFGGSGTNVILHVYTDTAGSPDALVAYTSPLALTGVDVELVQTGLSVALAAGTYWIGFTSQATGTGGLGYRDATGGSWKGILSGATFNPPSNPYGTTNTSNATRVLSVWGIVGAAAGPAFVPRIAIV